MGEARPCPMPCLIPQLQRNSLSPWLLVLFE
uniref:Uncharacterized protein n=1 Tax=Anguilla anguilla TaxID=7936 RepID=A0A0E9XKE7_ANGAN